MPLTSSTIKFVHDSKIVEITKAETNETLLNYIRNNLKKKRDCRPIFQITIIQSNLILSY